jgi:post-segregation antitoxin (ccd killing protein)
MSSLNVQLPNSLYQTLQTLAQQDGISVDQFVATAVAEKISALATETYLEELAQRGTRAKYDAVLAKVPDVEPERCDQLPKR